MEKVLKLKKGDLLIREGDASKSLYFVRSGALRVFKSKGEGFVELGVAIKGAAVGEVSFLDGKRRSASVEALRDSEVLEIARTAYEDYVDEQQPAWISTLFQTITQRIRTGSDRLRDLETNFMITKTGEKKETFKVYEFLLPREVMKLCSCLTIGATFHNESSSDDRCIFPAAKFQVLASNINSIHLSKITAFLEVFNELGLIELQKLSDKVNIVVPDLPTINQYMFWLSDEVAKQAIFQRSLCENAVKICEAVWATGRLQQCAATQRVQTIDLVELAKELQVKGGDKAPLQLGASGELVAAGLAFEPGLSKEGLREFQFNVQTFLSDFAMLRIKARMDQLNVQKLGEVVKN